MIMEEIKYSTHWDSLKKKYEIQAYYKNVRIGLYNNMEQAKRLAPEKLKKMKSGNTEKHIIKKLNS